MENSTLAQSDKASGRAKIALISNHGYAGVTIPVGGARDTGGQNFYVNSLAKSLESVEMDVTIFTRGGFPFFQSDKLREGTQKMSDHIRYVYLQGGGSEFIRKEDIAIALDEEVLSMDNYIREMAADAGVLPWEYFECINTHYWDAAVIACLLVERWQNEIAFEFIKKVAGCVLSEAVDNLENEACHKQGFAREFAMNMGKIAKKTFDADSAMGIVERLLPGLQVDEEWLRPVEHTASENRDEAETYLLGKVLAEYLTVDEKRIEHHFAQADTHVWTPHSVEIIKERNYFGQTGPSVRKLKFRERNAHEEYICARTPLFCSTSPELWRALVSFHEVEPEALFSFPPCIDGELFRPRTKDELTEVYSFFSQASGIAVDTLKKSKIVFETSRMDRTKRKDLLLRAFEKIVDEMADTYLFIGGGPNSSKIYTELKALKKELPKLEGRAFLVGYIPEELINLAFSVPDLFVSASEMEGFGMSVSQAAAAEVAVLSSDCIPFATQYAKGAAVIVEAGNVDGFAAEMKRLLADDQQRLLLAKKIKEAADALEWKTTTKQFVRWYRKHLKSNVFL